MPILYIMTPKKTKRMIQKKISLIKKIPTQLSRSCKKSSSRYNLIFRKMRSFELLNNYYQFSLILIQQLRKISKIKNFFSSCEAMREKINVTRNMIHENLRLDSKCENYSAECGLMALVVIFNYRLSE